jgi:hypothetical protein
MRKPYADDLRTVAVPLIGEGHKRAATAKLPDHLFAQRESLDLTMCVDHHDGIRRRLEKCPETLCQTPEFGSVVNFLGGPVEHIRQAC